MKKELDVRAFWNSVEKLVLLGERDLAEYLARIGEDEVILARLHQMANDPTRGLAGGYDLSRKAAEEVLAA